MTTGSVCPICKGPMKPLYSGTYCPNDCDRKVSVQAELKSVTFKVGGHVWRMMIVQDKSQIPKEATNSWLLEASNKGSGRMDDPALCVEDAALAWEKWCATAQWNTPGLDGVIFHNSILELQGNKLAVFWRES